MRPPHLPDRKRLIHFAQRNLPVIVSLTVVVLLVGGYLLIPGVSESVQTAWQLLLSGDRQRLREWVAGFGLWGPVVLMVAYLVQMFAFAVPSWLLIVVTVIAFGPVWGSILSIAGIALAASVAYGLGLALGELTLQRMLGEKSERRMREYLERYGFWVVVIFRLAPFLSNDVISFVAGLTAMVYHSFIGATVLGITPLIVLIAILGESNERLRNGFVVVSILSLLGFGAYVWWDHHRRTPAMHS
ncbi:MAG: TVP38/TMEM64 family protein [Chitinivibrionales bacterium]|nr:TVP38/TMEM64 family protein [Chitinivibrionales bacterium]